MSSSAAAVTTAVTGRLRRLRPNELVCRNDYVSDGCGGFALLSGLSGFRADAFVRAIYRREGCLALVKKPE
ncbi:MAG TPA: hypothetical protein VHH73_11970 [Verrucomicrobiae bacterium]|nr:hypothetical protein [Verrucomicrobiae bacterium]